MNERLQSRHLISRSRPPLSRPILQRKCDCGQHTGGGECEECKKKKNILQRHRDGASNPLVSPPVVHDVLNASGQPLDMPTRNFFETRFGYDFSQVRVHTDTKAAESARAVNALAYTVGNNIAFGTGRYAPSTKSGKHLLAHELTHTVQQDGTSQAVMRQGVGEAIGEDESLEAEAESVATEVMADEPELAGDLLAKAGGGGKSSKKKEEDKPKIKAKPKGKHHPKPPKPKPKPKPNPCTRDIFFEGTCQQLVKQAGGRCCDPTNGLPDPAHDTDVARKPCPSKKFTPMFTCDNTCAGALKKGCSDNDNWMAIPRNQFSRKQCGDVWTICANGRQTQGYVREKSVTQSRFEVSARIIQDLGVPSGTFKGAVYVPGSDPKKISKDPCCSTPTQAPPSPTGPPTEKLKYQEERVLPEGQALA